MRHRPHESMLVLCDGIIREAGTNKPHLHGIFDRVNVPALPAGFSCWLFLRFYAEDPSVDTCWITVEIERPGGASDAMNGPLQLVAAEGKFEGHIHVQGFPVREAGVYRIVAMLDGETVAATSFRVVEATPQIRLIN